MQQHYNAFISYRHHPDDIRVGEQVHRSLERFHVPAAIKKRCGKIQRLFRDKDELPITSNLTEDITRALKNADYLIVICSEHTAESLWVQREIELFLTTHDRSKVLTVLASGQPKDTIPEILQYEEVTDPVTGQTRRQSVEPLSCDWRMPHRKVMREELPRLAAALLGCGYDELRQRQRQYRTRRMVAGLTAALAICACLTGYFLYTGLQIRRANDRLEKANEEIRQANDQLEAANEEIRQANDQLEAANEEIHNNLMQALENQSQYLASSAQERLNAGDRLTAIALAMAALPQEDQDRPYVAQAELALAEALGVYNPTDSMNAVAAFTAGTKIVDFCISPDGGVLYALDSSGLLYIWDTQSFAPKAQVSFYDTPEAIFATKDGNVLVDFGLGIACYEPDGDWLWSMECYGLAFLTDGTILVLTYDNQNAISYIDSANGNVLRTTTIPNHPKNEVPAFATEEFAPNDPILLSYFTEDLTRDIYALQNGSLTYLYHYDHALYQLCFDSMGNVLLLLSDGTGMNNGRVGDMWTSEPAGLDLVSINLQTGTQNWQYSFESYFYSQCCTLAPIPGTQQLLCQFANEFLVLDLDGNLVNYSRAASIPVNASVTGDYFGGIMQDGNIFFYYYDDTVISLDYLPDGIAIAKANSGFFVSTGDAQITVFRSQADIAPEQLTQDFGVALQNYHICGDRLLVFSYGELYCYDLHARQLLWSIPCYRGSYIPQQLDADSIWVLDLNEQLLSVNAQTGELTTIQFPTLVNGEEKPISTTPVFTGNRFYYTVGYAPCYLASYDPITQDYTLYDQAELDYDYTLSVICAYNDLVYLWMGTDQMILSLDRDGNLQVFSERFMTAPLAVYFNGDCFLANHSQILSLSGSTDRSLTHAPMVELCSIYPLEDSLALLFTDGTLQRYDLKGNFIAGTSLIISDATRSLTESSPESIQWYQTQNNDLVVSISGHTNLIQLETWQPRAYFSNCFGYYAAENLLVIHNEETLHLYPCRSTEQILQMAQAALGSYTLPREIRENYGLD